MTEGEDQIGEFNKNERSYRQWVVVVSPDDTGITSARAKTDKSAWTAAHPRVMKWLLQGLAESGTLGGASHSPRSLPGLTVAVPPTRTPGAVCLVLG